MNSINNINISLNVDLSIFAQDGGIDITNESVSSWEELRKIIFESLGDRGPPPGNWARFSSHDNDDVNIKKSLVNYVLY
ncbi:hypothetical protein GOB86_11380 [Acetobacter lambici]|uniref:Uncharacterized protein n=1 Tax=Acetobacter lambici TaxID=1332824 RepID=A0ABT1F2I5_9PROT|nr:hypothetical protein [Acetobacter lambici]MCP1243411.1 hypothetical protein [Acetobacter lambici]MCP1259410.1 hypothetical protein [Acetobacter lambici]NHO57646.1 hypothetical protein [Acetobacter lambici]